MLQAVSAVGQPRVIARLGGGARPATGSLPARSCSPRSTSCTAQQYLHARQTLAHLLELGVVPVINENDAVADDEIRFGDNDRLAALVAHLVGAERMVLLTDTAGLLTADPRRVAEASLIEEVVEIDHQLELPRRGTGLRSGAAGMASKLAAAKIATWSGIETVIAEAGRPGVLPSVVAGEPGAGTVFRARPRIAAGPQAVDRLRPRVLGHRRGRRRGAAGPRRGRPLAARGRGGVGGWTVRARRRRGGARRHRRVLVAKGLVRCPSSRAAEWVGRRSDELPDDLARELIHRDDMVVLGE